MTLLEPNSFYGDCYLKDQHTPYGYLYYIMDNLIGDHYRDKILKPLVVPALKQIGLNAEDDKARPHHYRPVNAFL